MGRLAPGHYLLLFYLKRRIKKHSLCTFIEVGSGSGYLSNLLLKLGLRGEGFDLNAFACEANRVSNEWFVSQGLYKVRNADFLNSSEGDKVDLIISSMVLEHLTEQEVGLWFTKVRQRLKPSGLLKLPRFGGLVEA